MRDSKKFNHCAEMANKCVSQAESLYFCTCLAPTVDDSNYANRKYKRAVRHARMYFSLMDYYRGVK